MKTKTVEKSEFEQHISEKIQEAHKRQLEKMAPAKPEATVKKPGRKKKLTDEEKRELHKQKCKEYREKKKQEKLIEIRKENEANDARAYAAAQVAPERSDEPKKPEQKRENLFDLIKKHFEEKEPIYKTDVEKLLDESNKYFKRLVNLYRTQIETQAEIIEEQTRQLGRLDEKLNEIIKRQRFDEQQKQKPTEGLNNGF